MIMREILELDRLTVDLMHGRGGVCDGRHLIGIVLLPPVERCRDITADEDLADILPVIGAGETKTLRE